MDEHMNDIDPTLEESLTAAEQHIAAVVDDVMNQCQEAHEKPLAEVDGLKNALCRVMEQLQRALDEQRTDVGDASGAVVEGTSATDHDVANMTQALEGLRELLARFTF